MRVTYHINGLEYQATFRSEQQTEGMALIDVLTRNGVRISIDYCEVR
jgi:hypothetical protein